jgi:hypothetical protein
MVFMENQIEKFLFKLHAIYRLPSDLQGIAIHNSFGGRHLQCKYVDGIGIDFFHFCLWPFSAGQYHMTC